MTATEPGDVVARPEDGRWVGMRRACEILGVNQSTLRHWSDTGRVPVFLTPGGHRRYREQDLRALVDRPRGGDEGSLASALLAIHDRYQSIARRGAHTPTWIQDVDEADRRQFRLLGNSLLRMLSTYVISTSRRERERALAAGREVAGLYGEASARRGLSHARTTEAFITFRTPVLDAVHRWLRDRPAAPNTAEALRRVNHFMDQALLAVSEAHESAWPAQLERVP